MKSLSFSKIALLMVVVVSIWATSCKEEVSVTPDAQLVASYDANLALSWYNLFLEIDRYSPGYRPPAAARLLDLLPTNQPYLECRNTIHCATSFRDSICQSQI